MLRDFANDVDELVRGCIGEAEERFEEIEAAYGEAVAGAGEDLEGVRADFEEPLGAVDGLLEQLRSSVGDLELAKEKMERGARRVEEEHREREEALEGALEGEDASSSSSS